ncbi:uncharacterized mitochondrial protein-like protein [Tanacetum coccineum]|uniref:Uncharacterized mitochondrial protein-like protein n=1 Tax=Tanacetum coccineum TaxID=301880 RepID=A0ABQ4WZC7_9ASTR
METKNTSSSGSDLEEPEIQKLQMQAKNLKENSLNKLNALKSTTQLLERQTFSGCQLYQQAFAQLFGDGVRTFKFQLSQHMNNLETQLNAETLHEMDSKSALSVIKAQFERFINSDLLKPLDIYSRSFSSDREVRENFRDYTKMTAQTFKETIIQNMNSIEQCIIERASHEQELKMTLKKLSERQLQIQQCKVQEVQSSVTSSGDETSSGIVSDEEIDKQKLEAHYSYMAKIQEVSPEESSSTSQPLEQVQNHDENDVFANVRRHSEQPESINDTYVLEKDDSNVIPDSSNICTNDNQVDQNAAECVDERAALANLIANLTLDTEENKTVLKQLKKANASLTQELKECKTNLDESSRALGEATSSRDSSLIALQTKQTELEKYTALNDLTSDYKILQTKLNETLGLLALKDIDIKEGLKTKTYEISVVNQKHDELVKKSLLTRSQFEGQLKEKSKVISDLKVKEGKDIDTMIEMDKQIKFLNEILYKRNQSIQTIHMLAPKCATYNGRSTFANPKYLKKAQSDKPRLYEIPYDTSDPANRFCPNGEETVTLEKESRSKLDKDKVKPYDYTYQNSLYETFKPPSKAYLDQLERAKEVRKTMWRKTFVRTKPNHLYNSSYSLLTLDAQSSMTGNLKLLCNFVEKFLEPVLHQWTSVHNSSELGIKTTAMNRQFKVIKGITKEPSTYLAETTRVNTYAIRISQMIAGMKSDIMDPVLAMHNTSSQLIPDWLFDIDALIRIMNYEPIVAGTQSNCFTSTKVSDNVGQARKETEPVKDYILLSLWTADLPYSQDLKSSHDDGSKPSSDGGKKVDEDLKKESKCNDQEKEDNVNSTNNVNATGTNEVNVIGGKTNIKLPFDLSMPALEDISIFYFSRDVEDDGIVADMNNLDTTIQEEPKKGNSYIEGSKLDIGYAGRASTIQVEKALYGLHQAPRAWYETLSTYLLDNGFQRGKIDKTLFIKRHKGDILLVQVYVDDIIFGSTKKELCIAFKKLMHEKFQMSSMEELTFFLGLQAAKIHSVAEILKKFRFIKVKTASTPMETQKLLLKNKDSEEVDVHMYRSMIGSLMYLTSSRPDIMFALCACAKYQVNPKVLHLYAIKRIFRYLKGQPKLGLWYPKDSPFDLVAYTDSDYVGASLDRKSTIGEAEYVAALSYHGQVLWIQLLDYGDCNEKKLIQRVKIHTDKNVADLLTKAFDAKTINGEEQLHALVDGKKIIITESFVRRDLQLADEEARKRVLDLEKRKTTQDNKIVSLKRRVKKLEKKNRSRTHKLERLYKVGLTARVESSDDEESLGEDASKQGRIDAIDADEKITLVSVHDINVSAGEEVALEVVEVINIAKLIIDAAQVSATGDIVSAASVATTVSAATTTTATINTVDDITLAQALEEMKSIKPNKKGIVIQELEPVKPMKKKDQISLDEETALNLQAKFDEEERLARKKAKKEKEVNIAVIETWDDIQENIDDDHQLAKRMQA